MIDEDSIGVIILLLVKGTSLDIGRDSINKRPCSETLSTLRVGKTRPLHGHSIFGSISARKNFILACLHPSRSPTREAVCQSSGKTRQGAYLEYTQNVVIQHQGEDPMGTGTVNASCTNCKAAFTPRLSASSVERLANQRLHLARDEVSDWLDARR
ncbi:hypothetical protein TNCV_4143091 [Trichonephila clavipes]|nr:hypothetical protein TNCV_4143091 [Trichonephila clavipes]